MVSLGRNSCNTSEVPWSTETDKEKRETEKARKKGGGSVYWASHATATRQPRESQPRASGAHARRSSSRRLFCPCYFPSLPFSPSYFPRIPSIHPLVASVSPNGALSTVSFIHTLVASVSLFPNRALPMLFHTVSRPSALSSLPYASVSILPNGALPKLFPSHGFPSVHPLVPSISLLPNRGLPMLFITVSLSSLPYRFFPTELSPSYFPQFPFRPPSRRFRIAPSQRSSPQAISHASPPSTLSSLPYRSFPTELSPSYFPRFPFRPPSLRFRIAPSQRSSPHAISHGFPSLPYRSFPTELSPSYFPRFPFRPPYCRGSVYCACHAKGSQEALCTAPATRKRAAGQRRVSEWGSGVREWSEGVEWVSEWVSEWGREGGSEWVSEWEWVRVSESEWEWVRVSESEREWARVSESEWEWVRVSESEWEWVRVSESEWEWEWVRVSESEWEWVRVSECEWEWVRVSESEWEWVRVSESEWVWVRVRVSESEWEWE